ncbi:monocarboxylate transporter 9 isoform 3-T4 [Dugong dugon]
MEFKKSPDGGWGWVIVFVSFFTQFLCYGSPLAVGVLYIEWLDAFGEGKGKTAWVGSLASGVGLLASPVCSLCVSSFGARPVTIFSGFLVAGGLMLSSFAPNIYFLFFSYGIVVGLGCGLLYTATVTITCQYFDSRRGLALGVISTAGENVPERYFIYNEKEKSLEENISILEKSYSSVEKCKSPLANGDWKQEGPLHKNPTMAHTKETETYKKKVAEQTYLCKQLAKRKWQLYRNYCGETMALFKNKVFTALFIAILLFDIGGFPPSLLMEDVARSSNVKEEDFIMPLISIIGIMTAVGKLLLGVLADFKWINTLYLYVATLIIMGLALCAIPFAKSYVTLAILSGILGFLTGNWSIFPYVTTKTVGIEKLAHAYGILMFFAGIGNSLGPPTIGWFYDWTQTYDIAFYFSGFCVLLGGFILLLAALPPWDTCNKQLPKPAPTTYLYKVASNV